MLAQKNYQDAYAVSESGWHIFGVVCDGCGEGTRSEVGAALAAEFIAAQVSVMLSEGRKPSEIPALLYPKIVTFLKDLEKAVGPLVPHSFLHDYLLFTILGFA